MRSVGNKSTLAGMGLAVLGLTLLTGCGDTYRPIATPINGNGGNPASAYTVAEVNQNPVDVGTVSAIDVSGDSNSGNMAAQNNLGWVAYDKNRSMILVPNIASKNVSVLTSGSSVTMSMTSGTVPFMVLPGSSTDSYSFSKHPNSNCPSGGSIGDLNLSSTALIHDLCVGVSPTWGSYDSLHYRFYVLDDTENKIYVINSIIPEVSPTTIATGNKPVWSAMSQDNSYIYVLNQADATVSVISASSYKTLNTYPVGDANPISGYIDYKTGRLFIISLGSRPDGLGSISGWDVSNGGAMTPLPNSPQMVGYKPNSIVGLRDGSRLFVGNSDNSISMIDNTTFLSTPDSSKIAPYLPVIGAGYTVHSVAVSSDSTKIYAAVTTADDYNNGTVVLKNSAISYGAALSSYTSGFVPAPCQRTKNIYDLVIRDGGSGSLAASTYYYVVTYLDANGSELTSVHSNEADIVLSESGRANKLVWTPITDAISYNVYRGTALGGETLLVSGLPAGSSTYTDDGSKTPGSKTPPSSCLRQRPQQLLGWGY